jgi:hypothetical protein
MKPISTAFKLSLACAVVAAAAAVASAQTTSSGNLTTATTTTTMSGTTVKRKPPTTATPEMVNEAIQRSEARAAKARAAGITEQWGMEEPFTYNPAVRRFNADQQ